MGEAVVMSTPIPPPLRAAAGLAALAIDSARKAPRQLVGLPVLAVSTALQASLKVQQTYAGLVARGDEVLGQLRGQQQDAPWARFDDEPTGARPPSAFDTVPEPADEVDRDLDPDIDADVVTVAEALQEAEAVLEGDSLQERAGSLQEGESPQERAGALQEAGSLQEQAEADDEAVLGETEEDEDAAADAALAEAGLTVVDLTLDPADAERPNGNGPSTEPGADLPADGMALAADAAAADAALAADSPLDGYLEVDPPVPGYDELSIPQLRGRLRSLTIEQIEALVGYERLNRARPPYLTMLENRLTTLRSR
jgi:hypothetical protein